MNRRVLFVPLFCLALASCRLVPISSHMSYIEPDVPVSAPLVGTWTPMSAELGGKDFPVTNFGGASLHMTATTYEFAGDRGSYAVLSTTPPARMDINGISGPNAGKLIPAVFEVSGDSLTISYQLGPGVRPRNFMSPAGSQILLVHYRRTH